MREHLNSEAIDRHLAGERSPLVENHLRECAECREAVARMGAVWQQFHAATHAWSESQALSAPPTGWTNRAAQSAKRHRWIAPARWAAVATAALALAALPLYRGYSHRHDAAQAQADALLLEEVNADLSRPAPEPLEPLIELVSQSTTQSTNGDNR